jgi:hypothetical protein
LEKEPTFSRSLLTSLTFAAEGIRREELPNELLMLLFRVELTVGFLDNSALDNLALDNLACSILTKASAILSSNFLASVPGAKITDPSGPRMLMESDLLEAVAACRRAPAAKIVNKITITLFIIPTFSAALVS